MPEPCVFAGIDVSKDNLDLAVRRDDALVCAQSFPNTKTGIRRLLELLAGAGQPVRAVLEPTSRYHVPLLLSLAAVPGCQVMLVNPYRARTFQASFGKRAKTDPLDARGLARMAQHLREEFRPYTPPSARARKLQLLGRLMSVYISQRAKAKNRISSLGPAGTLAAEIVASLKREIKFCQREIDRIIRKMRMLVDADPSLHHCFILLTGIRGIAEQSALQLMSELLVLPDGMGPRQWVACAGLDPRPQQSGASNPPARISKMGNRYLKQVLYMAAMTTTQFEPQIGRYYSLLHTRKKSKILALVVVMRKLLHGIWWMLQKQQPFDATKCFRLPDTRPC